MPARYATRATGNSTEQRSDHEKNMHTKERPCPAGTNRPPTLAERVGAAHLIRMAPRETRPAVQLTVQPWEYHRDKGYIPHVCRLGWIWRKERRTIWRICVGHCGLWQRNPLRTCPSFTGDGAGNAPAVRAALSTPPAWSLQALQLASPSY
jgi:hypothetical protein